MTPAARRLCLCLVPVVSVALGACAPAVPEDRPFVRVSSGSTFSGLTTVTITADDRVLREDHEVTPDAGGTRTRRLAAEPGRHAAARALAEAAWPDLLAATAALPEDRFASCPTDLGTQSVTVEPPIAGVATVEGACGPEGVRDLMAGILRLAPFP
ncbi:hypothetical protein [Histidinibacterium lentulum]|uniref:Uncharacterized protein n=1 Tax=Histidinibacterium lentulum TaxID=2480588 RepID=A0A3N2RA42_9RHOB|nr:hypothetical protein [Histidinibacterium lentulum]ROU04271.1 hypothetical protein EAT49_02460 [Histidinibacterium lentulum]